ncbi:MAG: TonB-dependent receptor [Gammaproteobacteria bacterium]
MLAAIPAALATIFTSAPVSGQTDSSVLEEVVVTARKRAESLADVPISVSVTSGVKLDRMGISGLEELSGFTPNVQIHENATQQSVTIRGIGSGANQAFEQSVGTYVDGVYFGRGRSARNPFFDIERVEILKGPQGILFGKNTVGGAINITTRRPTDELEGYIEAEYFSGIDRWGISEAVSGPLGDTVRARLAASYSTEGGYVTNNYVGGDEAERSDYIVRGIVEWDVSDQLSAMLKVEKSSYDVTGRTAQLVQPGPLANLYLANDPNFETNLDYTNSTPGDDFDNTDAENFTLVMNYEANDYLTLTSISSYIQYDFQNNIPAEFAPVDDYAEMANQQKHDQFSEEIRVHFTSSQFEFLGGLYYQSEELDIEETFNFDLTNPALGLPGPPGGGPPLNQLNASVITFFNQETESFAVFGEGTYSVTDYLRLSAGLRYSRDDKEVDKRLIVAMPGTQTPDATQNGPAAVTARIPHAYALDRTDDDVSPYAGLQFDLNDDAMLYGTYSQGYKSGGFDAQNTRGTMNRAAFRPEEVKAWEIGGKFTLLDGAARFNIAAFINKYKNLQVAAWDGFAFVVENAASATSKGIELDGEWRITDSFSLGTSFALLDAEYDSFTAATCTAAQQTAFNRATGRPAGQCSQDISGKPLQFSPVTAGNINATYTTPLSDGHQLTLQGDVNFTSSYHTALDVDPLAEQDGFAKLNARVELASEDDVWSIAIIGKNLTDKKTTTWINDIPVFRGAFFGFIDPPRSIGVQYRLSVF